MFTWEIDNLMKKYQYNLPSSAYLEICKTSPQIIFIKREYDNQFKIVTKEDDNSSTEWEFGVYRDTD